MDAAHAYRTAAQAMPDLFAAIRRIEKDVLATMMTEGYGINQLRTALQESRYPLLSDDQDAANEYFHEILPQDAATETNFNLPAAPARFNMLYEKPLQQIAGIFASSDQQILADLQEQHIPRGEVREAYLGGSLYGILAGDTAERTAFEHRVWKMRRAAVAGTVDAETVGMQASFSEIWRQRSMDGERPIAIREGETVARFLRSSGAQEETAAQLLMDATEYAGRDKEAYARKIASAAVREIGAYETISAADTDEIKSDAEVYQACLKDAMNTLHSDTLPYEAEARIADTLRSAGMNEDALRAGILRASPLLAAAGRDPDKTLDALLTGKDESSTFLDGDYVTYADVYQRLLTDYDDALIDAGADVGVASARRRYNVLAARELLTKYGASEEEVKELLLALGGIPDNERTQEYLNEILAEAREVQEVSAGNAAVEEMQAEASPVWEGAARTQNAAVRALTQEAEDAKDAPEPIQEDVRAVLPTDKKSIREAKRRLRDYTFASERVRTRGEKDTEEMYENCREEIEKDVPLPFNGQMDEQIILHLFSLGYEEREIENAVQHNSPRRRSQRGYAKNIVKSVQTRHPALQNVIKQAETKYLQTKMEQGQTLTAYEKERVLVRDVPTG